MRRPWDVIVVGVGAMGAAALWQLASRGAKVLGLERHSVGHDQGSSHGGSRITREAYFEHPDYVPLLRRARSLWAELERDSRTRVVHRCGVLYGGRAGSEVLAGVQGSARRFGIPLESINPSAVSARFPAFAGCAERIDEFLFEPDAGFIRPERAILAMVEVAQRRGACLREHARVAGWHERGDHIEVDVDGTLERAKAIVLCPGAWAADLIGGLPCALSSTRQVMAWIAPESPDLCDEHTMPAFYIERDGGPAIYGVPMASDQPMPHGVKIGFHGDGSVCRPDDVDRRATEAELHSMSGALRRAVPGAAGPVAAARVCLYTNTPDGHFIVDSLPTTSAAEGGGRACRAYMACGFCGHGFKFAPVIGESLAELAFTGVTGNPIGFLSQNRFKRG